MGDLLSVEFLNRLPSWVIILIGLMSIWAMWYKLIGKPRQDHQELINTQNLEANKQAIEAHQQVLVNQKEANQQVLANQQQSTEHSLSMMEKVVDQAQEASLMTKDSAKETKAAFAQSKLFQEEQNKELHKRMQSLQDELRKEKEERKKEVSVLRQKLASVQGELAVSQEKIKQDALELARLNVLVDEYKAKLKKDKPT